ncbi:MAG: ABC transporter ATP-binding protein, partial [Deltaproteobacteria bacterium]|nr:ABC transporter ATP-binding protein [Deltaproteobacteria bacterium]
GKTVTGLTLLRLIPMPPGRIVQGSIEFQGRDLTRLSEKEMQAMRGRDISMIFQEPMTALNPVFTVGNQMIDILRRHKKLSASQARTEAIDMLATVGIPAPQKRIDEYPHQLSGGMRQRVMIAMALACKPDLLIADEPTTALDVTIQAQILELLAELKSELGMSIMLITHDLGVVAETCDEVVVMYAGRVVERARTEDLFASPRHHYTAGLLRSVPNYGVDQAHTRLQEIRGMVPALHELPAGCKFQSRCDAVQDKCKEEEPALVQLGNSEVRCHFPVEATAEAEASS